MQTNFKGYQNFAKSTMASTDAVKAMLHENVAKMNKVDGFDVVIVCTNNDPQASYWQQRLEAAK